MRLSWSRISRLWSLHCCTISNIITTFSIVVWLYMAAWKTRLLNCYYCWCSFYCFTSLTLIVLFVFIYLCLLAIRLPCFN